MNRTRKIAALLCMLVFLYGCAEVLLVGAGAGVGVASYMYMNGRLTIEYPMKYGTAWEATNKALDNLQISVSYRTNDKGSGGIEAVREDGKRVTINLSDEGNGFTSIAIRVGTFGDRLEAQKIHDEIISVAGF